MDFALSPQHEEIRRTVRDFAEREIMPVADELERQGEFPHEIIRKAADLGLLGVPYPEEVGGTGLDSLAYAITIEELSRASGSVGIIVSAHTSLGCNPIYLAGTDAQKERYLRPMASRPGAGRLRADRARCRLRLAGHPHPRAPRRRFVGAERQQALHHQCRRGGNLHRHRHHRSRGRVGAHQRLHRRGRCARLLHRSDGGEDGAARLEHGRAHLQRLPDPGRQPARRGG